MEKYMKSINLNNKDIIIVSLLEYICSIHKKSNDIFMAVCDYLQKNNIINKDSYSEDTQELRLFCAKLISKLLNKKELKFNENKLLPVSQHLENSRYTLEFKQLKHIGDGGFGSVFEAFHRIDENVYAIKKIQIDKLNEEKSKYYFNEVRILSKLQHKNIVRYYSSWLELNKIDNNHIPILYIQMELCHKSLGSYISQRNYEDKIIIINQELIIFKQIVDGIKYIHANNIIHGDLNPLNIFLNDNNIKIGDFGLSKKVNKEIKMIDNGSYGSVLYMSPEQLNCGLICKKSDIYSLGIIFVELFQKFKTKMEQIKVIKNIKNKNYEKIKLNGKYLELLKNMLNVKVNERFSIDDILSFIQ